MDMKTIVTMTDRGRITLPANVRKERNIEGESPLSDCHIHRSAFPRNILTNYRMTGN